MSIEAGELPRPLSLTRMETIVNTLIDHDLADLDLDLAAWARPEALTADARDLQEGEWAVFGAVAAVLGMPSASSPTSVASAAHGRSGPA